MILVARIHVIYLEVANEGVRNVRNLSCGLPKSLFSSRLGQFMLPVKYDVPNLVGAISGMAVLQLKGCGFAS